jgi:iron-sulfur cluster repair protein YtfE (RIC family)
MYKFIVFGFIVLTGCAGQTQVLQAQVKAQDVKIDELQAQLDRQKDSQTEHIEVAAADTLHWVFEHAVLAWENETSVEIRNHIKTVAIESLGKVSDEVKARASKCFDDIVSSKDDKALSCYHDITHS